MNERSSPLHIAKGSGRCLVIVAIAVIAAIAAGCGGHSHRTAPPPQPRLPRPLAQGLAQQSELVAARIDAGEQCGALLAAHDLQQRTIAAINAREVPTELQEPLMGAASRLVSEIRCVLPTTGGDENKRQKPKHDQGQQEGGG